MKRIKLIYFVTLSLILSVGYAQEQPAPILKVSYTTNNVSDFMIQMLKSQIKDPTEYSKVLSQVAAYKIYHSLYENTNTHETLYVLDSIHKVPGVSTVGHTMSVYGDSDNTLNGKEIFMGKEVNFSGPSSDLKWKITDEKKEINGYSCTKALLKNADGIFVWFTTDIASHSGPYMYYGLPGLILKSNGLFQSSTATKLTHVITTEFDQKKAETLKKIDSSNPIVLTEVITKKENFKRMAQQGKK